jgi:hypothetical protein
MNSQNKKVNYTVSELIEELKKYPQDLPVLVSGYEDGFENIMPPAIQRLIQNPNAPYYVGEFQTSEQGNQEIVEAVVLRRVLRND